MSAMSYYVLISTIKRILIMKQHIDYKCTIWRRVYLSSKEQLNESIEYLKSGADINDHDFYRDTIFRFDLESEEFIHPIENDNQVTIQAFNTDESEEPIWENKPLIQNEYVRINRIELSSEIAAMKMDMIYSNGEWQNIPEDPKGTITVKEDYQSEFHQYIDEAEEMILLCQ